MMLYTYVLCKRTGTILFREVYNNIWRVIRLLNWRITHFSQYKFAYLQEINYKIICLFYKIS